MRRSAPITLLFLLIFISFQSTNAQPAIIKDADGYSNIRAEANIKSKILDTLSNGRLVYILPEETLSNWLHIDYHKGDQNHSGVIHDSRIVYLHSLTEFKATIVKDTLLKLQLKDMLITIKAGAFVKAGRKIIYAEPQGEYQQVKTIDGKYFWGTDGYLPRTEYRSIQFKSGVNTYTFPKPKFNDLFSVDLKRTSASFDEATNTVYLFADNGDAAGSYTVIWVIKNGKIEGREIFIGF
jgi:hypothetical protein